MVILFPKVGVQVGVPLYGHTETTSLAHTGYCRFLTPWSTAWEDCVNQLLSDMGFPLNKTYPLVLNPSTS